MELSGCGEAQPNRRRRVRGYSPQTPRSYWTEQGLRFRKHALGWKGGSPRSVKPRLGGGEAGASRGEHGAGMGSVPKQNARDQ